VVGKNDYLDDESLAGWSFPVSALRTARALELDDNDVWCFRQRNGTLVSLTPPPAPVAA
jgi:hypothetical protein